ncbi:MAG: xanthine dehydrogenase family protein molybdopterin-binding subunit [Alphaproteobacteria bacterium]|nr:xanthine dehydrogenase family protein molybdopterin-binding subunit [Alphaproteobacteria bacterium]
MTVTLSRRNLLHAASAVALVVGFSPRGALAVTPTDGGHFNPFVKIDADGRVTAVVKHFEMGQGTSTGLPTLIAEELGVDLDTVAVEFAPSDARRYANLRFRTQGTGASTSMANSYLQYRQAGAAAREMLLAAAAQEWNADPSTLFLSRGMIAGAGRSEPISRFVGAAAAMKVPERPTLKNPGTFTLIGNPQTSRRDNGPKIDGSVRFAMDVQLENQLVAVVRRSPRFGGTVVSMDASAAGDVPGFVNAATLPSNAGVVVYARDTWSAFQAREAVTVEWSFTNAESRSSAEIRSTLLGAVNAPPEFVVREGPGMDTAAAALGRSAQTVEAEFFLPWLCHAPMEPLTCTIEPTADGVTLHDGCQSPSGAHRALAAVLGLPMGSIRINTLYAGGSFGRRATMTADYIVEAAQAFVMTDRTRPVKLVWSREDDLAGGAYRPAVAHRVRVGLDGNGDILAWDHRIAGKSIFKGSSFEQWIVRNGVDHSSVEGVPDTLYRIPGMFVGLTDLESPITVSWWRSVGHSHTAFVMESMMDMAAKAAGRDPVSWRLDHLRDGSSDQRRLADVLRLAARESGWDRPTEPGRARGVAAHKSFGTYVAQVVEVSRDAAGAIAIERITCAVDCGLAVNPDVVKAQMEGGIGYGIGHVMRNEITFDQGEVVEWNFPDYEPLRISDIDRIDVRIMQSSAPPTGVGEPGVPPAGPALANAIAVDGPRVTMLPMAHNGVRFA